jgi:hypothetical protein
MNDPLLLKVAIVVFFLLVIGLILTIYEFKTHIMPKDIKKPKKSKSKF